MVNSSLKSHREQQDFKSNKKDWDRFTEHIQKNIALVVQSLSHHAIGDNTEQLKGRLEALEKCVVIAFIILQILLNDRFVIFRTLLDVQRQIEDIQSANRARRVIEFIKDPKRIADMEKDLDRAVSLFSVRAFIWIVCTTRIHGDNFHFTSWIRKFNLGKTSPKRFGI